MKVFDAYIDESGDEGFVTRASPWFILAGVIVEKEKDVLVARSINRIKTRLWGQGSSRPLHWKKLEHAQKKVIIQEINKEDFAIYVVALEKTADLAREIFDPQHRRGPQLKYAMYFYAARLLAEQVTRYAARYDGLANLVFEHRSAMSYNELGNYLLAVSPTGPPIPLTALGSVEARSKETCKLLQVADACAGAAWNALVIDRYGNIEDSYLLELASKLDRVDGRLWEYGFKLFPRSRTQLLREFPQYQWMNNI